MAGSLALCRDGSDADEQSPFFAGLFGSSSETDEVDSGYSEDFDDTDDKGPDWIGVIDFLPDWSYFRMVKDLAVRFAQIKGGMPVSLGVCAGQAIPILWYCAMVQWAFYTFFMLLTKDRSECNSEDIDVARYPWWCLTATIAPVLISVLSFEWQAFKWVIIPKYQVIRSLVWLCFPIPNFRLWLVLSWLLSSMNVVTLALNSAFLGLVLKTQSCKGHYKLQLMWEDMMADNPLHLFLEEGNGMVNTCIIIWLIGYVPLIYALMETLPIGATWREVAFEVAYIQKDANGNNYKYLTEYPTLARKLSCISENQNHGESLMVMAEACQLISVVKGDLDYALGKLDLQLKAGEKGFELRLYGHIRSQIRRSMLKTFLAGFCVSSLQLWVQLNLLAMRAALNREAIFPEQSQSCLGVVFALIMYVGRIGDAINILCKVWPKFKKVKEAHEEAQLKEELEERQETSQLQPRVSMDEQREERRKYHKRCVEQRSHVRNQLWISVLLVLICVVWLGFLIAKLCALFICPYHVFTNSGCADFSDIVLTGS